MKKNVFVPLLLVFGLPGLCFPAFEVRDVSARAAAMADCYVASADDLGSVAWNPAGLSFLKGFNAAFSGYQWYPAFRDAGLVGSLHASAAMATTSAGVFAFSYERFGAGGLYVEQQFVLSHAVQFFRKISLGYSLKSLSLAIDSFGSETAFSADAGGLAKYSDKFRFGFFFRNLIPPVLAGSPDNASRGGEIGLAWTPAAGLLFALSVAKYTGYDLFLKVGQEIRLWDFLSLRSGFDSGSSRFAAGLGIGWKYFRLDYAFLYQADLLGQSVFTLQFDLGDSRRSSWRDEPKKSKTRSTLEDLGPEKEYVGEKVNINTAGLEELQAIPRVGPSTARSIVEFRDRNGPFLRKEDLMKVPRIGIRTYARLREFITVGTITEINGRVIFEEESADSQTIDTISLKGLIDLGVPPITAVKIVNLRDSKGRFAALDDLRALEGMTDDDFNRLKPVLQPLFDRRNQQSGQKEDKR